MRSVRGVQGCVVECRGGCREKWRRQGVGKRGQGADGHRSAERENGQKRRAKAKNRLGRDKNRWARGGGDGGKWARDGGGKCHWRLFC